MALDKPSPAALVHLSGGYCDDIGQIIRMPGFRSADPVAKARRVVHIAWRSLDEYVSVLDDGGVYRYVSSNGREFSDVAPSQGFVTSAVFDQILYFARPGQPMLTFDGAQFRESGTTLTGAAYVTVVQNRLIVADYESQLVNLSWADRPEVFYRDQPASEESVLRAGFLAIDRILPEAEAIKGLSSFEQNILLVFTQARTYAFVIDPDINQIRQEVRLNINVGALHHNAIVRARNDVLFASRNDVHSMRRALTSGVSLIESGVADRIQYDYREQPKLNPSMHYDEDNNLVWLATKDRTYLAHLGADPGDVRWASVDAPGFDCVSGMEGRTVVGRSGSILEMNSFFSPEEQHPLTFRTPVFWFDNPVLQKRLHSISLIFDGDADFVLEVFDHAGQALQSRRGRLSSEYLGIDRPDSMQHGHAELPLRVRSRGFYFVFSCTGKGFFRFYAIRLLIES